MLLCIAFSLLFGAFVDYCIDDTSLLFGGFLFVLGVLSLHTFFKIDTHGYFLK